MLAIKLEGNELQVTARTDGLSEKHQTTIELRLDEPALYRFTTELLTALDDVGVLEALEQKFGPLPKPPSRR